MREEEKDKQQESIGVEDGNRDIGERGRGAMGLRGKLRERNTNGWRRDSGRRGGLVRLRRNWALSGIKYLDQAFHRRVGDKPVYDDFAPH